MSVQGNDPRAGHPPPRADTSLHQALEHNFDPPQVGQRLGLLAVHPVVERQQGGHLVQAEPQTLRRLVTPGTPDKRQLDLSVSTVARATPSWME